jgi:hypothetical protein
LSYHIWIGWWQRSNVVSSLRHQSWRYASTWTCGWFVWWGGVSSTTSAVVSFDGVAQQGLDGGWMRMDERREVAAVWRRGAVNSRSGNLDAWMRVLNMNSWKMKTATSESVRWRSEGLLDRLVLRARSWVSWRGLSVFTMTWVGVRSRHWPCS